ncbi:GL19811 [Drosophila persimilis]|uniref:Phosphoglycolate phosphatase 2 n=2 Tax=pseudoobscura subgroup TaxID=32358 RepID=A0A6I8UFH1_DROPS|nr:phosphoglycolate phosphatase 2 [Drosophila pseudoobscura]XP_002023638.1 phosphoglycolate phosphatase 2 [Drosophila persimilis]EDW27815.1 GL19811 [Drosophila persimilis]
MAPPRHILELSQKEQRQFIDSFDMVISDCDGVVWMLVGWIPGTGAAVNALKSAGKQIKFVSNNSFRTDEQYMAKFKHIGANNVHDDDVVHPVKTIVRYLKKHRPGQRVYSLMSLEANETLRKQGIDFESLQVKEHLTAASLVDHLSIDKPVGAVLFDIHLDMSYVELAKAIRHLQQNEDCQLIAGGSDVIMPLAENLNVAGFFDFLEHVKRYTQREATFLGKPSPILGEMFAEMFEITDPKRCIFIGDTLVQDVQFGKSCGYQSLLVLSGCLTKEDMFNAPVDAQPDYYADSLADFTQLLQNIQE